MVYFLYKDRSKGALDRYRPILEIGTKFSKSFETKNYFLIIYKLSEKYVKWMCSERNVGLNSV